MWSQMSYLFEINILYCTFFVYQIVSPQAHTTTDITVTVAFNLCGAMINDKLLYAFVPSIVLNIVLILVIVIMIRIICSRKKRSDSCRRDKKARKDDDPESSLADTYQELNAPPLRSHRTTMDAKSGEDVEYHYYSYPNSKQTVTTIRMEEASAAPKEKRGLLCTESNS